MRSLLLLLLLNLNLSDKLQGQGDVPFITSWVTSADDETITIPVNPNFIYDFSIDWGDGQCDFNVNASIPHMYDTAGTYQISITGQFPAIYVNNSGDSRKLKSIDQWGNIEWASMHKAFSGAFFLSSNAIDKPNLNGVTDMSYAFERSAFYNIGLADWDMSNIINMQGMFKGAFDFNEDIGNWDVTSVENMSEMFAGAEAFRQDISRWDVSHVTDMSSMFVVCRRFDIDVSRWDVSQVTDMSSMFSSAFSFNRDISNWDVSQVTDMSSMFAQNYRFNQDIGDWDIRNVSTMVGIFDGADISQFNFDSILIKWSVQNVTSGVNMGGVYLDYCYGEDALIDLRVNHNWKIYDVTKNCVNAQPCASTQPNTWMGPAIGDWNVPANWTSGSVPTVCDAVIIPTNVTITLSDDAECYSIEIGIGADVEVSNYELIVWSL